MHVFVYTILFPSRVTQPFCRSESSQEVIIHSFTCDRGGGEGSGEERRGEKKGGGVEMRG